MLEPSTLFMKYLLFVLIAVIVFSQNSQPVPSCQTTLSGLNVIPVAVNEYQTYNLDYLFTGFNLEFNLSSEAPSFVHLSQKLEKVATDNAPLHGLRNFHLETINNTWGQSFILVTQTNWTTTVKWGKMAAPDALPVFEGTTVVETEANVICYDAIRFNAQGVIMVDCAKRTGSNGSYVYSNRFLYVNMTDHKVMSTVVNNKLYTDFRHISHRRFFRLTEDGYHYLIRVYFAEGVDLKNRNNTYMEVFTANNPLKPYILRVIDRSFLGQTRLAITDFKVYLGDLYILDYHQGLIRFDISPSQQIVITGRYRTDSGFLKFGVYSDDMDHEYILALANSHAIYEVDWTNQISPRLITKYSLMSGSRVDSVQVNNKYVVVQAEANVTSTHGFSLIYNTTWVFSRNSRTYSHAYVAIQHDSENTLVAFNPEFSILLSMDEEGLDLYRLGTPILGIYPQQDSLIDKQYIFTVNAKSINPVTSETLGCTYMWRSVVVRPDNYSLWETGIIPPDTYYANFPGGLEISLVPYVIGPNITYGVEQTTVDGELPEYFILKQNNSRFVFDKLMELSNITYLRSQQFESMNNQSVFIYLQDSTHRFYVQNCTAKILSVDIFCRQLFTIVMNHTLMNLTVNRFHYYNGQYRHLTAAVIKESPYSVWITDVEDGSHFATIELNRNFTGQITSIEFLGQFLVVTCKYAKTIYFYDMIRCEDYSRDHATCNRPVFEINSTTMNRLGIRYFAPLQVYVSDMHPYVLFVQNMDSVIIIDFSQTGVKLLAQITSNATKQLGYYGWRMAINRNTLVIVNAPDIIQEYSIEYVYQKRVFATRTYPLYNYTIPDTFDLDFSDKGDLIYITAQDKNTNEGKILVYRAGYPTVMTFYDVINMNGPYQNTLIDATGQFADYVIVASGNKINVTRQFAAPILIVYDTFSDFTFNITYRNNQQKHRLTTSTVKIANYPVNITINNTILNNQTYLDTLVEYKDDERIYTINDKDWFNGTVLNYTLKCESECGPDGKIEIIDHVSLRRSVVASQGMYDYAFTLYGGIIQQAQAIFKLRHNGSIHSAVSMPIIGFGETCTRVAVDWLHGFFVSACIMDKEVYLYLTSEIGYKPFTMGPYISSADSIAKIQILGNLLFLTDVDDSTFTYWRREGAVIIYRINHDPTEAEAFDELEVIDSNDFLDTKGWEKDRAVLGNSHVVWTNDSSLYRLILTEVNTGLFLIDFKWANDRDEIVVTKTNFINMVHLLGNISMPLPNDAHFEAVTILNETYNAPSEYWLIDIVVSVRNFHNFEINVLIDKSGTVLEAKITHVYMRYSYYVSSNYIKSFDGYFVTTQRLPEFLRPYDKYSPQVLVVYDTRPNRTNPQRFLTINGTESDIEVSHMLGGLVLNDFGNVTFDFNFTIRRNFSDPFANISLVVVDASGKDIKEVSISQNIQIITHKGIRKTQNIKLVAQNDYNQVELPFTIRIPEDHHGLPWWAIMLIVLGCLAVAAVVAYFIWRYYKAKQMASTELNETNKSLLQREAEQDEQEEGETRDQIPNAATQDVIIAPAPVTINESTNVEPTVNTARVDNTKQIEPVADALVEPLAFTPAPIANPQSREGTINESIRDEENQ